MAERPGEEVSPITLGVSLKLYLGIDESVAWARAAAAVVSEHPAVMSGRVRVFLLPSLPAVGPVLEAVGAAPIAIGAQDLFWEDRGAYTGAVSGADLARLGCSLVEVGHAERRLVFGEDAETTRRKLAAAVRNGLVPVLCVGESEEQDPARAAATCVAQLESALADLAPGALGRLVVAYEPEWAIGKPAPAPVEHVLAVTAVLRDRVSRLPGVTDGPVIYGGSAKPGLLTRVGRGVDGLFLGRFAHDVEAFAMMLHEAAAVR